MYRDMTAVNRNTKKAQGRARREERQMHTDTFRKTNGDRLRKGIRRGVTMQMRGAANGDVDVDINSRPPRMTKNWI